MTHIARYRSPLGDITIASNGQCIIGLWFEGQKHFGSTVTEPLAQNKNDPVLQAAKQWLDAYFSGRNPSTRDLPIILDGTLFQNEVWEILKGIPYGTTLTYGKIAAMIAEKRGIKTMSAQAVGNAVARNPVSIIIPCHRVIGENGKLTGYAGGIERKKRLLALESNTSKT